MFIGTILLQIIKLLLILFGAVLVIGLLAVTIVYCWNNRMSIRGKVEKGEWIMIKFKNTDVWGFEHALRGMRNPMNSWNKSDSKYCGDFDECEKCNLRIDTCDAYLIGENDMNLAQKLIKGGSEHRKFLRQIFVSVDITASMYWWSEFDTYKVGTTANSTSKMHKLAETSITTDMFELNDISKNDNVFLNYINHLEEMRKQYLKTKDKNI